MATNLTKVAKKGKAGCPGSAKGKRGISEHKGDGTGRRLKIIKQHTTLEGEEKRAQNCRDFVHTKIKTEGRSGV